MESGFLELQQLLHNTGARIIHIDAPPRSSSSALYIALSELADGSIFEPFWGNPKNFDNGCKQVANTVLSASKNSSAPIILVKDIARHLPAENWVKWHNVINHTVTLVRDPQLQLRSLLGRLANFYILGAGGKGLEEQQIMENADAVDRLLQHGDAKKYGAGAYEKAGWKDLAEHHRVLDQAGMGHSIVDASLLRADPRNTMAKLVDRLGLSFDEKLVAGWTKSSGANFTHANPNIPMRRDGEGKITNAWLEKAANSSDFLPPCDPMLPLAQMPAHMREYATQTAMPFYIDALKHPSFIGPKADEIKPLLSLEFAEKDTFLKHNVTTAYAMLSGSQNLTHVMKQEAGAIRKAFPAFEHTFTLVDRLLSHNAGITRLAVSTGAAIAGRH